MSKTINADLVRTLNRVSTAEAHMQTVENLHDELTAEMKKAEQNQIAEANKKYYCILSKDKRHRSV